MEAVATAQAAEPAGLGLGRRADPRRKPGAPRCSPSRPLVVGGVAGLTGHRLAAFEDRQVAGVVSYGVHVRIVLYPAEVAKAGLYGRVEIGDGFVG